MARIKANKLETLVQSANEATQPEAIQNDGVFNQPLSKGAELVNVPVGENVISFRPNVTPTREEWLLNLTNKFRGYFLEKAGVELPANIKASVGFPSKGAAKRAIDKKDKSEVLRGFYGELWAPMKDGDKTGSIGDYYQIFITPQLKDAYEIAAALEAQLMRTITGHDYASPEYKALADKLGMAKPFSQGKATPTGKASVEVAVMVEDLGPLPHEQIIANELSNGEKTIATRHSKVECTNENCVSLNERKDRYNFNISATWVEAYGAPNCPACGSQMAIVERKKKGETK